MRVEGSVVGQVQETELVPIQPQRILDLAQVASLRFAPTHSAKIHIIVIAVRVTAYTTGSRGDNILLTYNACYIVACGSWC